MHKGKQQNLTLRPRQLLFCRQWLIDRNTTKAAIRAGYAKRSAHVTGARMLKLPRIQAEIRRLLEIQGEKLEITAERVKEEIAKIAFLDLSSLIENFDGTNLKFNGLTSIPKEIRPVIKSIKVDKDGCVEIGVWSKEKALEMLARHYNLYEADRKAAKTDVVPAAVLTDTELFRKIEKRYLAMKEAREKAAEEKKEGLN